MRIVKKKFPIFFHVLVVQFVLGSPSVRVMPLVARVDTLPPDFNELVFKFWYLS